MNIKLISCEILFREACLAASRSPNKVDVQFLSKSLHDMESKDMLSRVQAAVDAASEENYDVIALGYALCNNGVSSLKARSKPLVITRAHDCITLFLESKDRYMDYFNSNPGTYYLSGGWLERGPEPGGNMEELTIQHKTGMDKSYEELVAEYGEDNAKYIYETLCQTLRNYSSFTFIGTGAGPDGLFEKRAAERAAQKGWELKKLKGGVSLIQSLLDGPPWDPEVFLEVPPGHEIQPTHQGDILAAKQ
jgi:hypothetical protein